MLTDCSPRASIKLVAFFASLFVLTVEVMGQVAVTTYHNDCSRTGLNPNETILTPANVNAKTFGLLFKLPVDGQVYAQPLYLPGVNIPGKGVHNVVYIATEHNSVYAFDADSNTGANSVPLWSVNLGPSVPSADTITALIKPEKGITGTPVLVNGPMPILYVVAFTKTIGKNGQPIYAQTLHALDATSGMEKLGGPRVIQGSVPGTGDGSVNGTLAFNPLWQLQRSALLYLPWKGSAAQPTKGNGRLVPANSVAGTIYVAFGSHGDVFACHGWVFAYDATNLQPLGVLCTGPNSKTDPSGYPIAGGTVWQGGSGPASDGTNIFVSTGNGLFNPAIGAYGDSILSFQDRAMKVKDYFSPSNQASLNDYDMDLGSGGIMLMPKDASALGGPNLIVQTGKEGTAYVLNRDNLGGYNKVDQVIQKLPHVVGAIRGSPAYFNGWIYYGSSLSTMSALQFKNGGFVSGVTSQTAANFMNTGAVPSVSANGKSNGIVWAIQGTGPVGSIPGALHAFDATNLGVELYNSAATRGRDTVKSATKFSTPTVVNGKVYVGVAGEVGVYGLGKWAPAPAINVASGHLSSGQTITFAKPLEGQYVTYTLDGSDPSENSQRYVGPVALTSSSSLRARTFGFNVGASSISEAEYLVDPVVGNGTGLQGKYFDSTDSESAQPTITRLDHNLSFDFGSRSPANGVNAQSWSATWTGLVQPEVSGVHKFSTNVLGGMTVWVNGRLVFDNSAFCEEPQDAGEITLVAGQKVSITVKYTHFGLHEPIGLFWSAPGLPKELIPTSQLYPRS